VWLTSIVSIVVAFVASKFLLGGLRTRRARQIQPVVGAGRHRFPAARWLGRSSWNSPKIFVSTKSGT